jgi:hypothetical protein
MKFMIKNPRTRRIAILLTGICLLSAGCAPRPAPVTRVPADPAVALPDPDSDILKRARVWVDNQVPYGSFDDDTSNDYYDGYRADCSGFVSYAWALPAPGPNTKSLLGHPNAMEIDVSDLMPGDALNNGVGGTKGHVVLFVRWKDRDNHVFIAYDENKTPGYASEKTFTLIPLLINSGQWTIRELQPYAPGPYHAQRLVNTGDVPFTGAPPSPGLYPIDQIISAQIDWEIRLESIEVMQDGTLKVNYSWLNLSSYSQSLEGGDQVRIEIYQEGAPPLIEIASNNCAYGDLNEVGANEKLLCWSTLGRLESGSTPFTLVYVGVGQIDEIILEK